MVKKEVKAVVFISIFLIMLLSYNTLATEIHDLANNTNTTNPINKFLDSWFGLIWVILDIFTLGMVIFIMVG